MILSMSFSLRGKPSRPALSSKARAVPTTITKGPCHHFGKLVLGSGAVRFFRHAWPNLRASIIEPPNTAIKTKTANQKTGMVPNSCHFVIGGTSELAVALPFGNRAAALIRVPPPSELVHKQRALFGRVLKVVSDTYMTAVIPAGATTGKVTVSSPGGSLTSNIAFRITKLDKCRGNRGTLGRLTMLADGRRRITPRCDPRPCVRYHKSRSLPKRERHKQEKVSRS